MGKIILCLSVVMKGGYSQNSDDGEGYHVEDSDDTVGREGVNWSPL